MKTHFVLISLFCFMLMPKTGNAQLYLEAGVPTVIGKTTREFPIHKRFGYYVNVGFDAKINPTIRYYHSQPYYDGTSDVGYGLGIAYQAEFENVQWLTINPGLLALYTQRRNTLLAYDEYNVLMLGWEIRLNVQVINNVYVSSSFGMAYGKPDRTYSIKSLENNWIYYVPYRISLGIKYTLDLEGD